MSKIIVRKMRFDNFLSYGESNEIDFETGRVVQLVGANGAGKSSIATALEECLFNKNSKGLSKSELFNWEQGKKHYHLEVDFAKDGSEYTVIKDVKSTTKLTLLQDGEDISGHTATQTYKLISDIFGCDFTTFTKIVYQSVGSSLDFLKTTDAKRKEFLTSLFDQEIYKILEADVKADIKVVESSVATLSGSISSTSKMLEMVIKDSKLTIPERVEVPEFDDSQVSERIGELKAQATLVSHQQTMIKKKIEADRRVREAQEAVDLLTEQVKDIDNPSEEELNEKKAKWAECNHKLRDAESRIKTFSAESANTTCKTCGSHLDVSAALNALNIARNDKAEVADTVVELAESIKIIEDKRQRWGKLGLAQMTLSTALESASDYGDVSDDSIDLDIGDINADIIRLQNDVKQRKQEVESAKSINADSDKKQALKDAALDRLHVIEKELDSLNTELAEQQEQLADLQLIAKSLKDIVGYKLEYNVKVFEELINRYLSDLTDGVFALNFELNATKLDVVIYNNGRQTSMASCSTGQQQRIQTATLLAIRALLSSVNKVDINLLFLDEVISYIDTQGIETLIEVLLKEPELNSFIVSHGHSHPMAEQIVIVQDENQVSRLVESK
ncbi:recombination related exonuclease [Providencia phage PSTCR5]|uniref:Recombination related exonuclease n=1 Tax=Providencia phage PSTCR5 TaxID=2783547 RepID=A0A873WNF3_9CAUD|nr:recombination related exonuclease [Providencia phage PSTCR5]QPB12119.1 recombination related exonuclease [Providencia phage PSTCR5]